jgi:hypothetical protein
MPSISRVRGDGGWVQTGNMSRGVGQGKGRKVGGNWEEMNKRKLGAEVSIGKRDLRMKKVRRKN